MSRVHHHHGVELESHTRPGSYIADARQKQSGDDFLVRRSLMNALSHLLQQIRLGRFLDQADQRLDSRIELHQCRRHSRLLRRYGRQPPEKREISNTEGGSAHSREFQKLPACGFVLHDVLREIYWPSMGTL